MVSARRGHARPRTRSSTILAGSVPDVETGDPTPNTNPPSQHDTDYINGTASEDKDLSNDTLSHRKNGFIRIFDQQHRIIQPLNPPTSGSIDPPDDSSA